MSHLRSLPPAVQCVAYTALSPSMVTNSFSAASSRSNAVAVTTTVSFWAKRRAVSFMMAKASGRMRSRTSSIFSSMRLVVVSISFEIFSFSSSDVAGCSSRAFISTMRASSSAMWSAICRIRPALCARSSSFVSFSMVGYTALIRSM